MPDPSKISFDDLFAAIVTLAGVGDAAAAAALPGATISQQAAAAGAAKGAGQGHGAPKKVATALGSEKYKAPIGALIIPHEHFIAGQPSHFSHSISQAKWVANQWKDKKDADDAAHKAVEAGTHHWLHAGDHEYAVHKGLEVHVPKDTDLHDPVAVKNAPKVLVKHGENPEHSEHMVLDHDGPSEPAPFKESHAAQLAKDYKPLLQHKPQKSVSFAGKHAAWVPHDWDVYKSAKETDESKLKVKFAKEPNGTWHYIYQNGKITEPPHDKAEGWVSSGSLVKDQDQAEDHGVHPLEPGLQSAKVNIGGIAVTKDELQDALAKLSASKSTQIKGLLKGHPLEGSDYHSVYKAELAAFPELKVPAGTKKVHVPEAKNAFMHHLAAQLAKLSASEGDHAVAQHAQDSLKAAAAHAVDLTPHTAEIPKEKPPEPEKFPPMQPGQTPQFLEPEKPAAPVPPPAPEPPKAEPPKPPEPAQPAAPAGNVVIPGKAVPGIHVTAEQVQDAIDALNAKAHSTQIKQILKAAGNPLWESDYWAVIHAYEAAHPSVKAKGTKQVHVQDAKAKFIAALQEKLDGLVKADQLSGHTASAELYALAKDGKLKSHWEGSMGGSMAAAAQKAVETDHPHYVVLANGAWVVTTVKPADTASVYDKVDPDLKVTTYDAASPGGLDISDQLDGVLKGWVDPKQPEPEAPSVPEPPAPVEPPKPPEPKAEPPKSPEAKLLEAIQQAAPKPQAVKPGAPPKPPVEVPPFTAEEFAALDAAVSKAAEGVKHLDSMEGKSFAVKFAWLLWTTSVLHMSTYLVNDNGWKSTEKAPQEGTFGAPLASAGFYEVTPDHHIIFHSKYGEISSKPASEIQSLLKKAMKEAPPPPPPAGIHVDLGNGVSYLASVDSTVWKKGSHSGFYVKEADGSWKGVFAVGGKPQTMPQDHAAATLNKWIADGGLTPVSDTAKNMAAAVKPPELPPPPPPPPVPEPPAVPVVNTGNDVAVTIKGTVVGHAPNGSKVYHTGSFAMDTKYVKLPDGSWMTAKASGLKPSLASDAKSMQAYLDQGSAYLIDTTGKDYVVAVHGVKVVGELPAGTKFYEPKNNYNQKLYAKPPDAKWHEITPYGISPTSYVPDMGTLVEKPAPTPADVEHLKELAQLKKSTKLAAVGMQDAKKSWQAAMAYGLTVKNGSGNSTWVVWAKGDGTFGMGNYSANATGEKWQVSMDTLEGTHTLPDGKTTEPLTYDQVKQAVQQHMIPQSTEVDGKVIKVGYWYNPKSSKTYLEVVDPSATGAGYHQYNSYYNFGAAGKAIYKWHASDGSVKVITPKVAAKYLEKNTEYHDGIKVFEVKPNTIPISSVKYATALEEGEQYHLYSATAPLGISAAYMQAHSDGSGSYYDPGSGYSSVQSGAVTGLLMGGTLLDQYGNTVVKPGTGMPAAFHLFGGKAMTEQDLKDILLEMEKNAGSLKALKGFQQAMPHLWDPATGKPIPNAEGTGPSAGIAALQLFLSEKGAVSGDGDSQYAAVRGLLKEMLAVPVSTLAAGKAEGPVFLKGTPKGINDATDVFKMTKYGLAVPYKGTISHPDPNLSLDAFTSGELAAKIKDISEQFGGGKVVGTHVASMSKDQRVAWLDAWRKGDMAIVFALDSTGGKVSPVHPGAPDNASTHHINWSPYDPAQVPATQAATIPGNWTPLGNGVQIPKSEADNYLIKVGVQHASYLSYKERRDLVMAHRKGNQEAVDNITRMAEERFKTGASPLSEPPQWSDNVQPAKSYTLFLEDNNPADKWSSKAIKDFYADNKDAVEPFVQAGLSDWLKGYYTPEGTYHGFNWLADDYSAWAHKGVQGYLDDVAAKALAEKLKPKYEVIPGSPGKVTDQFGKHMLWFSGPAKDQGMRVAVSALARAWGFRTPLAKYGNLADGTAGVLTPEVQPIGTLAHIPGGISSLTDRQLADIAREHVLDYALFNPWSTPGDYLRLADGSVVAADKHGAFGNMVWQGADRIAMNDWSKQPVSQIFDAIANGTMPKELADKAYAGAMRAAQRMSGLSDSRMTAALADANLSAADMKAVLARKAGLVQDIQKLWEDVYKQAGWELPPAPAQALTHGLHSGFSEPEFFPHVMSAKSFGVPAFFAGQDLAGGHVHVWTEVNHDGNRLIKGEATLVGKSLDKLVAWANGHSGSAATLAPKDESTFQNKILTAAEVVNTHAKDGDYSGPLSSAAIKGLFEAKAELTKRMQAVEHALASGPDSTAYKDVLKQYGDPAAVIDMTKYYLAQVQSVEDHKSSYQGFKPTDLPGWQPAEHVTMALGGVKVTFKKAHRALGTDGGDITANTWTLGKQDGELHLAKGKSTDYQGSIWEVVLPTGEVIEINDKEKTNTPLAQRGRIRFTAVTGDQSASLERIRSMLQQAGMPMEEATPQDMENLYWRQLAGILADRVDAKTGLHGKVWDVISQAVHGYDATNTTPSGLQNLIPKFLAKGLSPEEEAAVWRQAWANLTSIGQVNKFVEDSGHLPHLGHFDIHSPDTAAGKPSWYRFDVKPEDLAGKKLLVNNFKNYTTDAALIARSGGLYSSEARLRALGTYKPGMSWGSDQEKGSSGVVFLRQGMESKYHDFGAWVSPRVMARFDTYSFPDDKFGDIEQKKTASYFDMAKATSYSGGGNEAMPSDAVSLMDDIEVIKAYDESQRQQIISDLKGVGITMIRGLPVEDRIVTTYDVTNAIAKAKAEAAKNVPSWLSNSWMTEQAMQAAEEAKEK